MHLDTCLAAAIRSALKTTEHAASPGEPRPAPSDSLGARRAWLSLPSADDQFAGQQVQHDIGFDRRPAEPSGQLMHHQARRDGRCIDGTPRGAGPGLGIAGRKQRRAVVGPTGRVGRRQHAQGFAAHPAVAPEGDARTHRAPQRGADGEVIDIFAAAGMERPDISILSDEFLAEVRDMPQRNLALEVLRKLLSDEIRVRSRKNLVQSRSFAEMLDKSIKRYQNRSIDAAQVIAELVDLAKEMRAAQDRGDELSMTDDEIAFYDALEVNHSAVNVLGDETLRDIARELVESVRRNVTIDWTVKESVRAKLRVLVKRILKKYGYPPDKQAQATETVLQQAELLCVDWAG